MSAILSVVCSTSSLTIECFLTHFTIERINPNSITIEPLLYFMQKVAAETEAMELVRRSR